MSLPHETANRIMNLESLSMQGIRLPHLERWRVHGTMMIVGSRARADYCIVLIDRLDHPPYR
jgi:hypothetical protein